MRQTCILISIRMILQDGFIYKPPIKEPTLNRVQIILIFFFFVLRGELIRFVYKFIKIQPNAIFRIWHKGNNSINPNRLVISYYIQLLLTWKFKKKKRRSLTVTTVYVVSFADKLVSMAWNSRNWYLKSHIRDIQVPLLDKI